MMNYSGSHGYVVAMDGKRWITVALMVSFLLRMANDKLQQLLLEYLPHTSVQWVELQDEWVDSMVEELMASGILGEPPVNKVNDAVQQNSNVVTN